MQNFYSNHRKSAFVLAVGLCVLLIFNFQSAEAAGRNQTAVKLLIDTDAGVDDMAALGWLFAQERIEYELVGVTTVAGNTSVDNATNNVLTLMDAAGINDVPVVMGAISPLNQPLSASASLIHGPDGFWFSSQPHDLTAVPTDAAGFICAQAAASPDLTIVTIGPLTNIANAVAQCPDELAAIASIVILGGAETTKTPRADFNIWQDTVASAAVLDAGLPISMVTIEAAEEVTISTEQLAQLQVSTDPIAQLLAFPLTLYAEILTLGVPGDIPLYDLAAVSYALRPNVARTQRPALVKIVQDEGLAYGQTIMGFDFNSIIPLVTSDSDISVLAYRAFTEPNFNLEAELFALFSAEPMNAIIVTDFRADSMGKIVVRDLAQ